MIHPPFASSGRRHFLKNIGWGIIGAGWANSGGFADGGRQLFNTPNSAGMSVFLNANENPYGPSPAARKVINDHSFFSNRYHWESASQLMAEIAGKHGVGESNVVLGAGSTAVLELVARYAGAEKGNYIMADPSYPYWAITLDRLGCHRVKVPLTPDKKIDLPGMAKAVGEYTRLVYICNPNNPTGTLHDNGALLDFIKAMPQQVVIVVDEAYLEYTGQPSLCYLISQFPNLVVVKTFSKIYGLAGARVGYGLASKPLIDQLADLQSSPNSSVSVLSRLAASASLKEKGFLPECLALNETAKNYTVGELEKLHCDCIPSRTNFLYFSLARYPKDYFQQLSNHQVEGTGIYEESGKWTRITIGTLSEMQAFIRALQ